VVARSVQCAAVRVDAFEQVLLSAGLSHHQHFLPREAPLSPEDAAQLHDALLETPVTLGSFGPRLIAGRLLRDIMEGEQEVERAELLHRLFGFLHLSVLRPDGYLARAWDSHTQQRVGPVQWREGAFRAGPFVLGSFYAHAGGVFHPVDEHLIPVRSGLPLAEVYDDADVLSRTLDGAEEAFVELALAVGQLLLHPLNSLEALKHLPESLATLIASSPEYLERLRYMTRGEQIQAVSKLVTTLVGTYGTAAVTTRTVAGAIRGAEALSVPALSLSAEGTLVVQRVSVGVGEALTVLSGGPGAAILLQRANSEGQGQLGPSKGPGQWGPSRESMSKRAARYQEQIGGHPVEEAYWVGGVGRGSGGVKFDGYRDGVLLEAKGPGYANKFLDNLEPEPWFRSSGARELIKQADRQFKASKGTSVRWHVAEEKAAKAIRKLLKEGGVPGVEVVHTPALP
jgi:hypothetical protein